jgi:hypothetical protein
MLAGILAYLAPAPPPPAPPLQLSATGFEPNFIYYPDADTSDVYLSPGSINGVQVFSGGIFPIFFDSVTNFWINAQGVVSSGYEIPGGVYAVATAVTVKSGYVLTNTSRSGRLNGDTSLAIEGFMPNWLYGTAAAGLQIYISSGKINGVQVFSGGVFSVPANNVTIFWIDSVGDIFSGPVFPGGVYAIAVVSTLDSGSVLTTIGRFDNIGSGVTVIPNPRLN